MEKRCIKLVKKKLFMINIQYIHLYYILQHLSFEFTIKNNDIYISLPVENLLEIISFLKYHSFFKSNTQLINILAVDYPDQISRFTVIYCFNIIINQPFRLYIKIKTNELQPVESITKLFPNASWYEREIWDLFGVFFLNSPNLRRILNDYGFQGHPFRKDFPLSGFAQVQYDITKKRVISQDVQFSQQNRIYNTI